MSEESSGPFQDVPNTHKFATYRACTYRHVDTVDVDHVAHHFHVPLEVVAAITSPLNQIIIDRNSRVATLEAEVEALKENVLDLLQTFEQVSVFSPRGEDCDATIPDSPYIEIARYSKMRARQTLSKYFLLSQALSPQGAPKCHLLK